MSSAKIRSSLWHGRERFNASCRNRSTWPSSSRVQRSLREDCRHGERLQAIVEGKYDDIPEQAFYMKGPIEEVLEAAEKMKTAA